MQKTFLFYDIETTGLNKAFDQVLQFAAIRTDLQLNELARHEILVRLSPDVIPSPRAILTHQISVSQSLKDGINEVAAIRQIHQLMNTPGTISIGYNSLDFDDKFLRFSFYRNLLTPYTHQFANQCGRADLFPITILYFLFKNEILNWPQLENKISLKLEHLNHSNQLTSGMAHNAMVDVCVTLELAKRCQQAREMWEYSLQSFDKNKATERILKLPTAFSHEQQLFREGLIIDGSYGFDQFYQSPVLLLGTHRHYKNKTVWLRLDKPELQTATADNINGKTWASFRKTGEDDLLLPHNEHYGKYVTAQRQQIIQESKQFLLQHPELLQKIASYHLEYKYPKVPNIDIDAALYEVGFATDYEQLLCRKFHEAPPEKKYLLLEQFPNENLREQASRILGRHYPEFLPNNEQDIFQAYLQKIGTKIDGERLVDYRGEARLTPQKALEEITELRKNELDNKKLFLLEDLEQYLRNKFCRVC